MGGGGGGVLLVNALLPSEGGSPSSSVVPLCRPTATHYRSVNVHGVFPMSTTVHTLPWKQSKITCVLLLQEDHFEGPF